MLVREVPDLLLDHLPQDEPEQLVVILRDPEVLPEPPLELLLDAELLRADEARDGALDGQVDVVGPDVLAQVHLGGGFGHPDHRLEVTDRDGIGAGRKGLAAEVGEEPGHLVLVHLVQLRPDLFAGVLDVLAQHVLRNDLCADHDTISTLPSDEV